jgi:uncharacterized protein YkwD
MVTTLKYALLLIVVCAAVYAQEDAAAEQELFRDANQARAKAGVPALEWNEWLAQAALAHAQKMLSRNELSHQFPGEPAITERLASTGLRFDASAENVAFGATAAEIQDGWMHSPGHRENMLNPRYNAIGIAVLRRGNSLYAVSDFAHTVPKFSATDVENTVAETMNQIRARQGLPPLNRVENPQLRQAACNMARANKVDAAAGFRVAPQLQSSIAFTDSDPKNFTKHLAVLGSTRGYHNFAVGACFARSPSYPEGTNWVIAGVY